MTEAHSQTHAQDERGGVREMQGGSLEKGAQVQKRTKDGIRKRELSSEEQRKNTHTKKEGVTAVGDDDDFTKGPDTRISHKISPVFPFLKTNT